jgi:hypothetical protein
VLAVVSDVKLGVSTSSVVDYYIADVVEMTDYEPGACPARRGDGAGWAALGFL